jgi:hypothetical protein
MKLRRSILTILIPSGVTLNDLGTASKHREKSLANPSRHRSWALNSAGLCSSPARSGRIVALQRIEVVIIMNHVRIESIIGGATRWEVPLQNQGGGPGMLPMYEPTLEERRWKNNRSLA